MSDNARMIAANQLQPQLVFLIHGVCRRMSGCHFVTSLRPFGTFGFLAERHARIALRGYAGERTHHGGTMS